MSRIKVGRFTRKPFSVDAILVTSGNIEDVAEWCKGEVLVDDATGRQYIKVRVQRPLNDRQTMAFVGDWILYAGTGYKVYTSKAFAQVFDPIPDNESSETSNNLESFLDAMRTAPDSERENIKEKFFDAISGNRFDMISTNGVHRSLDDCA